mgnify:CR=1 FL=1
MWWNIENFNEDKLLKNFQSLEFYDLQGSHWAPHLVHKDLWLKVGGFSEELKEFTWALGAEYVYDDSFALRAGYFNESEDKGARKFLALGAGFKFSGTRVDLSYLFSASRVPSPLENTLRFSLTFDFGSNSYLEY